RRRLAEHWAAITVAEKECCVIPQGLPGTAGRGPACPVVWEAGGEIPPPTRLSKLFIWRPVIGGKQLTRRLATAAGGDRARRYRSTKSSRLLFLDRPAVVQIFVMPDL